MPLVEIVVVAVMTAWAWLVGRSVVRWLDRDWSSEAESWAVAVAVGFGVLALTSFGLGMVGWLSGGVLAFLMGGTALAASVATPLTGWRGEERRPRASRGIRAPEASGSVEGVVYPTDVALRLVLALGMVGTFLTSLSPVTDGDALCYHLQVPKVFLEGGRVVYEPDLHETVYPLVVEMLYVPALAWGGPVACRLVSWVLGLCFAGIAVGMGRPVLGHYAGWAGAIALLAPAVSNGMSAPLNDVALATFSCAALWALCRWIESPSGGRAALVGILSGLAVGVKYPALVWVGLIGLVMLGVAWRRNRYRELAITAVVLFLIGGGWYARAAWHTGNPVHPFFRQIFRGSGLDEVLEPAKRPLRVTPWNLATALGPMTIDPDRFDSISHQFGPLYLALLPGLLLVRPSRRVVALAGFGMLFYVACLTQRQSMRFLLPALGPWSIAAAWLVVEVRRRGKRAGAVVACVVVAVLAGEAAIAVGRARHGLPVLLGQETSSSFLARREPTYTVGRWIDVHLPRSARILGQDHRGFYLPRPYTMELAHRRRTGLGSDRVDARVVVEALRRRGFTHLLLCPPVPEDAVEFDPTLGRLLAPWLGGRFPLYHADLTDGAGVLREYSIYALDDANEETLAGGPER